MKKSSPALLGIYLLVAFLPLPCLGLGGCATTDEFIPLVPSSTQDS